MPQKVYLDHYSITEYSFLHRHCAGPSVYFPRPCIGYIVKGEATFLYRGKLCCAHAGDLIYIAPETTYYSVWTGDPDIFFYSLDFSFSDRIAFMDYRFQILHGFSEAPFRKMAETYESDFLSSTAVLLGMLAELYPLLEKTAYDPEYKKILPAIEMLEKGDAQPLPVGTLAAACGYSASHFYAIFRKLTGVTPGEYKNGVLVRKALKLLTETETSVEGIAAALGFSSPAYFRRVFFSVMHTTPGRFRKKTDGETLVRTSDKT